MNNKIKPEKYRKLSVAAFVTGILTLIFFPVFFIVYAMETTFPTVSIPTEEVLLLISWFTLPVTAIVCGSIDIKRIKAGSSSNKGRGFDIAGIVMSSIILILATSLFIDMFYPYMG